jgi:hypothetical protein
MADYSIFPSILPSEDKPFVDNEYSKEELDRLNGNELQSLAAKHPTDEVNGQSPAKEIKEALEGEERV